MAVFQAKPALHRFPGSMGKRTYALCRHLADEYGGDAAAVWTGAISGDDLLARVEALPGFGEEKAKIFVGAAGQAVRRATEGLGGGDGPVLRRARPARWPTSTPPRRWSRFGPGRRPRRPRASPSGTDLGHQAVPASPAGTGRLEVQAGTTVLAGSSSSHRIRRRSTRSSTRTTIRLRLVTRRTDPILTTKANPVTATFEALGVSPDLVARLHDDGILAPFPIQALTIRDGLAGRDVCGKAKTGSGKTLAFGLPLVERVGAAEPHLPDRPRARPHPRARQPGRARCSARSRRCGAARCRRCTAASASSPSATRCAGASTSSSPRPAASSTSSSTATCGSTPSRCSCSTKPTACSTWASRPRCRRSCTASPSRTRRCCSRPRSTARSVASSIATSATRSRTRSSPTSRPSTRWSTGSSSCTSSTR